MEQDELKRQVLRLLEAGCITGMVTETAGSLTKAKRGKCVKIKCPVCGKEFERLKSLTHLNPKRNRTMTLCSPECNGKASGKRNKEFLKKIEECVIEEF